MDVEEFSCFRTILSLVCSRNISNDYQGEIFLRKLI